MHILVPGATGRIGAHLTRLLIEPQSVFARWLFLQEAINFFETLPAQSPSQLETLAILKSLDKGTESLVIMVDEAGNPEIREWSDARDVAAGCVQALTPESTNYSMNNFLLF